MSNKKEEATTTQVTNSKSKERKKAGTIMKVQSSEVKRVEATPENMLMMAIQAGRSMEEIGALIKFRNDELARLARLKFIDAKKDFTKLRKRIVKKRDADYGTTSTGKQGAKYKFEDLDAIEEVVKDVASDCGFTYDWKTKYEEDYIYITCILSHVDGHFETDTMRGKADTSGGKNLIQADSSTTSYLMRYTLKKVMGLSTGLDDNDGTGGANKPKEIEKKPITDDQYAKALVKIAKGETTLDKIMATLTLTEEQFINLKAQEDSK